MSSNSFRPPLLLEPSLRIMTSFKACVKRAITRNLRTKEMVRLAVVKMKALALSIKYC